MGYWPPKNKRNDCFWIKVNHLKYSEKHFFVFSGWRAGVLSIGTKFQIWTQIFLVGVNCLCQFTYLFCSRCSPTPCENFDTGAHILDKTTSSTVHSPLTTSKEAVFVFCAWDQAAPLAGACFLQIFKRLSERCTSIVKIDNIVIFTFSVKIDNIQTRKLQLYAKLIYGDLSVRV